MPNIERRETPTETTAPRRLPTKDEISCGWLYLAFGGYEADGGKYEGVQRLLSLIGWRYDIALDSWVR